MRKIVIRILIIIILILVLPLQFLTVGSLFAESSVSSSCPEKCLSNKDGCNISCGQIGCAGCGSYKDGCTVVCYCIRKINGLSRLMIIKTYCNKNDSKKSGIVIPDEKHNCYNSYSEKINHGYQQLPLKKKSPK